MLNVCSVRGEDNGNTLLKGFYSSDALTAAYSSDIGRIVTRSTAGGYIFALGATELRVSNGLATTTAALFGYLAGMDTDPTTKGSTTSMVYIHKFSPQKEYEITYSTLYSTTLPATSDIGSYIGLGGTTTVAGAVLDMTLVSSTNLAGGTTQNKSFIIKEFDNNRRKIFCSPVLCSSGIAW
jgi:hypothetical protein